MDKNKYDIKKVNKIKKFVYPVIASAVAAAIFICFSFGGADDILLGLISLLVVGAMVIIAIPAFCFWYSVKIIFSEKRRYLWGLYNSFVMTLFYLLPLCMEGETYIYSAVLFAWCAAWTMLPLLISKKTHSSDTNHDKS
ncbi:MAG: hypothetical protein IJY08_05140 [Clostridia bacterium]|nr:hypothetical protein [Clostridia bacterium]